jgi:hypothetical protein
MLTEKTKDFAPWRRQPASRRRFRRWSVTIPAVVQLGGRSDDCVIRDLSPGGAWIEASDLGGVAAGTPAVLELPAFGPVEAEVRHIRDGHLGLMFLHGTHEEEALALHLVTTEPRRRPHRQAVQVTAMLKTSGVETPCVVVNMARAGARVLLDGARHLSEDEEVALMIGGEHEIAAIVRHLDGSEVGLMFLQEFTQAATALGGNDPV